MKKKYILWAGIALLAFSMMSFTKSKVQQAQRLFEQIKIAIAGVGKMGLKNLTNLWFDIDVALLNPTAEDFYITTGGVAQVKVVRIYYKEQMLGFGKTDGVYSLNLPAGGRDILKNIRIEVSLLDFGNILSEYYKKYKTDLEKYKEIIMQMQVEVDIDAFGQIYTLRQSFA